MDAEELAHRQYVLGLMNRRVAASIEHLNHALTRITSEPGLLTVLCACGREDCQRPSLTVTSNDYDRVRESPHRFLIAPGHTTEIDDVIYTGTDFAIVEIQQQYQQETPATADTEAPRGT